MKTPKRQSNHLAPLSSRLDDPSVGTEVVTAVLSGFTWLEFFTEHDFQEKSTVKQNCTN